MDHHDGFGSTEANPAASSAPRLRDILRPSSISGAVRGLHWPSVVSRIHTTCVMPSSVSVETNSSGATLLLRLSHRNELRSWVTGGLLTAFDELAGLGVAFVNVQVMGAATATIHLFFG